MESIYKDFIEYSLSDDMVSDICALLNSLGGNIVIAKTDDEMHKALKEKWKNLSNLYYEMVKNLEGHFSFLHFNLSDCVFIRRQKRKNVSSTIIEVKPAFPYDGVIVYNMETTIHYFIHGKKVSIKFNDHNLPFINDYIKRGRWPLPHAFSTPLRDQVSYTIDLNRIKKENNASYYWLNEVNNLDYLYKYMSLTNAMLCLNNSNIFFNQPACWDDQYEKRFYNAKYVLNEMTFIPTHLFACCFTSRQNSEAAWHIYSHNKEFSKSIVVEFKLNFQKLLEQLIIHLKDCDLFIGKVKYLDEIIIDNLHKPKFTSGKLNDNLEIDNPYYYYYFERFSRDSFLDLLLLKRDAFEHEQEIRFFIVPKSQEALKMNKLVNINWIDIIEHVRIDGKATDEEKEKLENVLNRLLEEKKSEVVSGIKKMKTPKEQEDFLSNSFVHSGWDDNSAEEAQKSSDIKINEYFKNLKKKIKPIVYDVYSSNLDETLVIQINN